MLLLNFLLTVCLLLCCAGALYGWRRGHQREKLNNRIADELDTILAKSAELIREQRNRGVRPGSGNIQDLQDPGMLSTLITVIINKYGNIRLGLEDFSSLEEEEYVSVYLDTRTNDLILSLNHTEGTSESFTLSSYTDPDDNTFH